MERPWGLDAKTAKGLRERRPACVSLHLQSYTSTDQFPLLAETLVDPEFSQSCAVEVDVGQFHALVATDDVRQRGDLDRTVVVRAVQPGGQLGHDLLVVVTKPALHPAHVGVAERIEC